MVGPAAKREAVAHLQAVMGVSERRACSFVGADRKMVRYPPETELRTRLRDLATSAAASAIDACSFCSSERASHQGSIASTGSTARRT